MPWAHSGAERNFHCGNQLVIPAGRKLPFGSLARFVSPFGQRLAFGLLMDVQVEDVMAHFYIALSLVSATLTFRSLSCLFLPHT